MLFFTFQLFFQQSSQNKNITTHWFLSTSCSLQSNCNFLGFFLSLFTNHLYTYINGGPKHKKTSKPLLTNVHYLIHNIFMGNSWNVGLWGKPARGGRTVQLMVLIDWTRQCLVLALETLDQPHSTMVQPSSQTRGSLVKSHYVRLVHRSTQKVTASVIWTLQFLMNLMFKWSSDLKFCNSSI